MLPFDHPMACHYPEQLEIGNVGDEEVRRCATGMHRLKKRGRSVGVQTPEVFDLQEGCVTVRIDDDDL